MKTIPEKYEGRGKGDQKGFSFELLQRSSTNAVYIKRGHGGASYEAMRIRTHKKPLFIQGIQIAEAGDEFLPSSNQWGQYGWTFSTLEQAQAKFNEMEERDKKDTVK
jgi:hypothetical protein